MRRDHVLVLLLAAPLLLALGFGNRPATSQEPPERRLLLTAFAPYGTRPGNASAEVLREIRKACGDRYEYEVLPVSLAGEKRFRTLLEDTRPAAVVSLGEDPRLPESQVSLEPFALVAPLSQRIGVDLTIDRLDSPWAHAVAAAMGLELRAAWGYFYCNRVHLCAVRWAEQNGDVPALFVHVARRGDPATTAARVRRILDVLARLQAMP